MVLLQHLDVLMAPGSSRHGPALEPAAAWREDGAPLSIGFDGSKVNDRERFELKDLAGTKLGSEGGGQPVVIICGVVLLRGNSE